MSFRCLLIATKLVCLRMSYEVHSLLLLPGASCAQRDHRRWCKLSETIDIRVRDSCHDSMIRDRPLITIFDALVRTL
ncbi:uncharacterized protein GGS25DRAFT_489994 [Hypoxylon fragiforme]|uniref:uncharacterized protein n=1 Tax=Hypoxylon fragiforme TaxID=63214 RepID=UPI0020C72103|nr:uncharacterized protein GGS25DRAFT_489994 [Hypoxylon fragiforme]KAI2608384.1 hypothetical protein GGS25DRAFT_489994 [Hypoxylon fragiforme]